MTVVLFVKDYLNSNRLAILTDKTFYYVSNTEKLIAFDLDECSDFLCASKEAGKTTLKPNFTVIDTCTADFCYDGTQVYTLSTSGKIRNKSSTEKSGR